MAADIKIMIVPGIIESKIFGEIADKINVRRKLQGAVASIANSPQSALSCAVANIKTTVSAVITK